MPDSHLLWRFAQFLVQFLDLCNLSVRPTLDAVRSTDFLKEGDAYVELFRDIAKWKVEMSLEDVRLSLSMH